MLVRAAVSDLCELARCQGEEKRKVVLAVDEACANIIRHTFQGDPCQSITIFCQGDEEKLVFVLTDCGPRVDVQHLQPRDIGEVRPGGLGTHFIRTIMDEVDYRFEQGCGNVLRMVKYLHKA